MSEIRVLPFQNDQSNLNNQHLKLDNNNIKEQEMSKNNNIENVGNTNQSSKLSVVKAFITSKKGIIILSVIGVVVVASVIIAVVATRTTDEKNTENSDIVNEQNNSGNESNNSEETHKHFYGNQDDEYLIEDEESNEDNNDDEDDERFKNNINPDELFISPLLSLTQNNLIQSKILDQIERIVPSEMKNEGIEYIPVYNGDNSDINQYYNEILEENLKLVAGTNTYDEIGEDGKLYLKGEELERYLYKHSFSKDLYGGNIDDNEKAVIKEIKINPISNCNYITGLYAPPGEVIKVEISEEDLNNIGGVLEFRIGQVTQSGQYSQNSESVGLKRVPILINILNITKTTGYIGSFIGGPIYISNPSRRRIFTVKISNAVEYKHIIFGTTTKEDFELMQTLSAPFFELDVRDSIRYSGPLLVIDGLDYDNLIQNLIFWDKCVRTSKKVPSGSNINLGIHFLFDSCVNSKGALALAYVGNNWCQVPLTFKMALNYETITKYGAWGHIHELNHHFQKFGFSSSVSNEVTNNVINLVEYIIYSQISGLRNEFSEAEITTISNSHKFLNPEHALSELNKNPPSTTNQLEFYEPILQAFGYDKFIQVTQYGKGAGGIDLFYQALTQVLHHDFTYYVEQILNLKISEDVINECQAYGYHIFIPVSCIYQTGRYYTYDHHQYFSNTSFPYRIPGGGPYTLDFENHIIVPNGFTYEIIDITEPENGNLEKISDLIYKYTPNENGDLSGIIILTIHVINAGEEISTNVKLGLNFEVDNSKSIEIDYIYDEVKYTSIYDAIDNNFEGYSNYNYFQNLNGYMSGISEGNIGVWEGKFQIDDDGYKYILYRGGRGPSVLFAKINEETEYKKIGEILVNQDSYQFNALAHYEIDLKKGDIVTFKICLLAKNLNAGKTGFNYLGISKVDDTSKVRTLKKAEIFGINYEFNKKYEFYSGDPYKEEKQFDSNSFFDYNLVTLTSPNFEPWSDQFTLEKMIDRKDNTYMHTKQSVKIKEDNPLTLIFDLGRKYYFDYISFKQGGNNYYLPKKFILSISEDGENWVEEKEYTTEESGNSAVVTLEDKLYSRYIKLHIIEASQPNPGYIAIKSIEFLEKETTIYYQKNPEFPSLGGPERNIEINFDNFPYFGHSYVLTENCFMNFILKETTGIKIKVCNKYDSKVSLIIDNDNSNEEIFEIIADEGLDFPIEKRSLTKGKHKFEIIVNEGKLDFEYILYEL